MQRPYLFSLIAADFLSPVGLGVLETEDFGEAVVCDEPSNALTAGAAVVVISVPKLNTVGSAI